MDLRKRRAAVISTVVVLITYVVVTVAAQAYGGVGAKVFRNRVQGSTKDLWQKVILPLLGAIILFTAFVKTAIDSYASDFGETAPFGIGGVFVLGIGSILIGVVLMVIWTIVAPAYLRGETMRNNVAIGEQGQVVSTESLD
jgi:hypothetical protein